MQINFMSVQQIPIEMIISNPYQVRGEVEEHEIEYLTHS